MCITPVWLIMIWNNYTNIIISYRLYSFRKLNDSSMINIEYYHRTCQQFIYKHKWIWCFRNKTEANLASAEPWLLDAFELFMLKVFCNSHCFLALCCALHRITSRVIHRTELFLFLLTIHYLYVFYSIHNQWQTTMILLLFKWKFLTKQD